METLRRSGQGGLVVVVVLVLVVVVVVGERECNNFSTNGINVMAWRKNSKDRRKDGGGK